MIDKETLQRLAASRSPHNLYLSVFVSTSRLDDWRQTVPSFLNSERQRIERDRALSREDQKNLDQHFGHLREVLQYDVRGRTEGLSLFANSNGGPVERIELPVRLANQVVVAPSPYLRPLVRALDQLEPFLLVRVSRDESSILVVDDGGVSASEALEGPYLKSTDRETGDVPVKEYFAAARQDTLVEQHYKEVAAALDRRLDRTGYESVVLCGLHDILANFRRELSNKALARVKAEIPWDAAATENQQVAGARQALAEGRLARYETLAQRLAESLGQGRGVVGFDDTMTAVHQGKLQTLLVDRDYAPAGWVCQECDFAGLTETGTCPLCGGAMVRVDDVAAEAVRVALLRGTYVIEAEGLPTMADLGGIAGLGRYR
jgi:hypothetical protein